MVKLRAEHVQNYKQVLVPDHWGVDLCEVFNFTPQEYYEMWFANLFSEVALSTNLLKTLRIDEVFKDFCKLQTVETRLSMDEILNKHVKVFMIITHQYLKDENFSDVRRAWFEMT